MLHQTTRDHIKLPMFDRFVIQKWQFHVVQPNIAITNIYWTITIFQTFYKYFVYIIWFKFLILQTRKLNIREVKIKLSKVKSLLRVPWRFKPRSTHSKVRAVNHDTVFVGWFLIFKNVLTMFRISLLKTSFQGKLSITQIKVIISPKISMVHLDKAEYNVLWRSYT